MPWLKLLHISSLVIWCGALLYLPLAIASGAARREGEVFQADDDRMLRGLFNLLATPAALVAIASGTAIFVIQGPMVAWLMFKLVAVSMLVMCHALCGVLILRVEQGRPRLIAAGCAVLTGTAALLIIAIAWLVLRKPF